MSESRDEFDINEIEDKVASGSMTAAQVFTQMRQQLDATNKSGYMSAVDDITNFMGSFPTDAETIRSQFGCE